LICLAPPATPVRQDVPVPDCGTSASGFAPVSCSTGSSVPRDSALAALQYVTSCFALYDALVELTGSLQHYADARAEFERAARMTSDAREREWLFARAASVPPAARQ
jgi:hypothetical protein